MFIYVTSPNVASLYKNTNIKTCSDYIKILNILDPYKEVAIDIETYVEPHLKGRVAKALNPHTSNISLVTLRVADQKPVILDFKELSCPQFKSSLYTFLESRSVLLAHNGSFEAKFLKKHLGLEVYTWWCTRVAAQLISNALGGQFYQQLGGNDLKSVVLNYLDIKLSGKKKEQIEDWYPRPLTNEQLDYASHDVLYLHRLKEIFIPILTNPLPDHTWIDTRELDWGLGMSEVLELEMQYVTVEAEMELNGLPVNEKIVTNYQDLILNKKAKTGIVYELASELAKEFGYTTSLDLLTGKEQVSDTTMSALRSPDKLKKKIQELLNLKAIDNTESSLLNRLIELYDLIDSGNADPFYSKDESEAFQELLTLDDSIRHYHSKILVLISNFKRFSKQATMDLRKYIDIVTNRIHSNYNSLGARTGRTSSSKP